ncbi:MAG: HigA family addiction module antitoxin [Bacteroidota bacterium]
MKKWEEQNPGGVNGVGDEKVNVTSENFIILRKKIVEDAGAQTQKQILENKVLTRKLQMLSYLNEDVPSEIKGAGEFLKELLEELNIKNNRFAEYVGLHPANLSSLLSGRRKLNTQLAIKLDEIFNIRSDVWMKIQTKNDLIKTRKLLKQKKGKYNLGDLVQI